jgi:hypothetical protein
VSRLPKLLAIAAILLCAGAGLLLGQMTRRQAPPQVQRKPRRAAIDRNWPRSREQIRLGGNLRLLKVELTPPANETGELGGEIAVVTNIPSFERLSIPVTVRVVPPVAAMPSMLSFGEVSAKAETTRAITLVSLLDQPIKVLDVAPRVSGLRWSLVAGRGGELQLEFTAAADAVRKLSGSSLQVRLEAGARQAAVQLPVHGWEASHDQAPRAD